MRLPYLFFAFTSLIFSSTGLFEENLGQVHERVRYLTSTPTASVFFTANGVEFLSLDEEGKAETMRLCFEGSGPLNWAAQSASSKTYHYHLGSNGGRALDGVRRFEKIEARNVYPGIDVFFYFSDGKMEYDFRIQAGAKPETIRLLFAGPKAIELSMLGEFSTRVGVLEWRQKSPIVYQRIGGKRQTVASHWIPLGENRYQFEAGDYNREVELTLDPVLEFASYLGGDGDDEILFIGEGFVAGTTKSNLLEGGNGRVRRGRDIFLRTDSGRNLNVGSTVNWRDRVFFFGGSGDDVPVSLNVFLTQESLLLTMAGTTSSRDFFPSGEAKYLGGESDVFYANFNFRLNSPQSLMSLNYTGAYFGGSGEDRLNSFVNAGYYFLAGTTTSIDLPVVRAFQQKPGGGRDAFFAVLEPGTQLQVQVSSYFGGEGDDEAMQLNWTSTNTLLIGETRSPSVEGLGGALNGGSDAFLIELGSTALDEIRNSTVPITILRGRRFGGSGEDRFKFIQRSSTDLLVVGESNSSDYPMLNPRQAALGGGTDIVIQRLDLDSLESVSATYFGGNGEDTVRQLSVNSYSDVLILGDTLSTDLPVVEALQPVKQGGLDGFYGYFKKSGEPVSVAYFGGSGDDSIRAGFIPLSGPIRFAGTTSSKDLPEVVAWQEGAGGSLDGFVAEISMPFFSVPEVAWVARGLRTNFNFRPSQPLGLKLVTAKIDNPSVAAFQFGDQRSSELTLGAPLAFSVEALADEGETTITLTAPGYVTQKIRLRVGKGVYTLLSPLTEVPMFAVNPELQYGLGIVDPTSNTLSSNFLTFFVLSTADEPVWRSTNPAVLRVAALRSDRATVNPVSIGTANIEVTGSLGFWPEGGSPIRVVAPRFSGGTQNYLASPLAETTISFQVVSNDTRLLSFVPRGKFRLESEDPSKLLLKAIGQVFTPSVELELSPSLQSFSAPIVVTVKALDSEGIVRVRLSSPNISEDAFAVVELRPAVLETTLSGTGFIESANIQAAPNSQAAIKGVLKLEGLNGFSNVRLTEPVSIGLRSTNPSVALPEADVWSYTNEFGSSPQIKIGPSGSAEIQLSSTNPFIKIKNSLRIESTTRLPAPFRFKSQVLGNQLTNLVSSFYLYAPPSTGAIEVIVDNPELVQLSRNATDARASRIQITSGSLLQFYVHGLAETGSTTIRARLGNSEFTEFAVQLVPSGFAFKEDRRVVDVSQMTQDLSIVPYALDPNTLEPLEEQLLQPGVRANLSISSNSENLVLARNACTVEIGVLCSVGMRWSGAGDATITLDSVPGFRRPSFRQSMLVRVKKTPIGTPNFYAVQDSIVQSVLPTGFSQTQFPTVVPFRIISLDPDKVLFSSTLQGTGQESINSDSRTPLYIHGVGGTGIARYRIEGANLDSYEGTMPVYNWTITLVRGFTQLNAGNSILRGSTLPYSVSLRSSNGSPTVGTRPGLEPIRFELRNSDPRVLGVQLQPSIAAAFPPGRSSVEAFVTGIGVGSGSVTPVAGTREGEPISLVVRLPRLASNPILMADNSQTQVTIQTEAGATTPNDNTIFSIRSLDPSRLRFQGENGGGGGLPEVNYIWPANRPSTSIRFESYAGEGSGEFEILLPGFEPHRGSVHFAGSALVFANSERDVLLNVGADFQLALSAVPVVSSEARLIPNLEIKSPIEFRSGFEAASIPIQAVVDNPSVVAVADPPARLGNTNRLPVQLKALAAGTATVRLETPPGFVTPDAPDASRILRVQLPALNFFCSVPVANESTSSCTISTLRDTPITVRTGNALRLQLSLRASETGRPELTIPAGGSSQQVYFHGLSRTGSTRVTFSANGYRDYVAEIPHLDSGFFFANTQPYSVAVNGVAQATVEFYTVSADGQRGRPVPEGIRPGAVPASVPVRVSDPRLISVTPSSLVFQPGEFSKSVQIRGLNPGSATVELGSSAGFAPPTPAAILVRVN